MKNLQKYSFIVLNTFLLLGVLLSSHVNDLLLNALFVLIFIFFISFLLKSNILCSLIIYVIIFLFGVIFVRQDRFNNGYIYLGDVESYICKCNKTIELNSRYRTGEFIILKVKKNNKWENVDRIIKIQIIVKSLNIGEDPIFYGDIFLINESPKIIVKRNDKKSSNLYNYTSFQGIYYHNFISFYNMKYLGNISNKTILYNFDKLRLYIKKSTLENIKNEDSKCILSTLLFCKGDQINKNLKDSYSLTGVSHILSISGLHIGLIFFIITQFLMIFGINKKMIDVISLIFIWFYGFLVMMPASVLRANLMISFYKINNMLDRNNPKFTSIFNTFIISLIIKPTSVYSIGFQLSYLATLAIITFSGAFRFLDNIFKMNIKSRSLFSDVKYFFLKFIPKYIISSLLVSLSVLIFTFPVILYNFHRFNFISFLLNIIIVPLFSIVVFIGIFLILLSEIPLFNQILSLVIDYIISFINKIVVEVSKIDFIKIEIKNVNLEAIFIWYSVVFILIIVFSSKIKNFN